MNELEPVVSAAWEERERLTPETKGEIRDAVEAAIDGLDRGVLRVASPGADGRWTTHEWLKKAVLLCFRLQGATLFAGASGIGPWWDKLPQKTAGWDAERFLDAGFRSVPGAIVRRGAFVGRNAVLMPSFVNIGAYVGEGAMIDTWATVGSCAQIGRNVHISGGAGIGGVLEPLQAAPVIIEDDVFIGARSEVVEGVIVRQGAVLAMGVFISGSTKIVDRATGAIHRGEVPAYAVVAPGALPDPHGGPSLACAVIVKRVDEQTRKKTAINDLLRD
jgi:2,3,4,5-tetrahydropyridine-2-carboxylate N-succinyltransferase